MLLSRNEELDDDDVKRFATDGSSLAVSRLLSGKMF